MMTNAQLIEPLAKERFLEKIASNSRVPEDQIDDLCQCVYEQLLMTDNDKLNKIYTDGILHYWATRVLLNNFNSKTSRYYYIYRKYYERMDENHNDYTDLDKDDGYRDNWE